jgi:tetratricopeptide (TPR) repeat protein
MHEQTPNFNVGSNREEDWYHWYQLGISQLEAGSAAEAIASFNQALNCKATDAAAWYGKGKALVELEQYEAAIGCYEQALSFEPDQIEGWSAKGKAFGALSQYAAAIDSYETALSLQRKTGDRVGEARTLFTLNMLYPLEGRMAESAEAFQQMTQILSQLEAQKPNDPFTLSIMGGVALPNQTIFFLLNRIRQISYISLQGKLRSALLSISWFVFYSISLLLIGIIMLAGGFRSSQQSQAS